MAELWRDRYEPLEVVGQGGQGSVVRALDHLHRRHVALKIRPVGPPQERDALLGEARLLLGLEPHPLVTLARDDFFLDDRYVLVMDWVEGTSLAERLARTGQGLPVDDVLAWLAQVGEALDHLHRHRPPVVHGDVKPANVVVTPEGKAVLVDFGIARRHAEDRSVLMGTRHFTAPELATGAQPTPASDVFSLAATAYVLLTGHPPRPGDRQDWRTIAGEAGDEVEVALRRGLAFDPSRRPASAGELVQALRGKAAAAHNLPAALTSFVGRQSEVARVADRLCGARLLTLTGAGGLGKTRLAVEVAAQVLCRYPDGVFLVELAALGDPTLVPQQILVALGVSDTQPQATAADGTVHALHVPARAPARVVAELLTRRALLVLDNCEHLVDACASVADALLRACPNIRILATSREPLRVPGEVAWRVEPLSIPDPARLPPLDVLADYEGVGLFVERATAADPTFRLTAANAADVAAVCARLEGIPLAIELAAARTPVLTVAQISKRLDDRFRLLAGGSRTSPRRHQSLRAAVDWTYDALAEAEQALFQRLSVFSGGFTLEAAERVCPGEPVDELDLVDLLSGLVEKSLVVSDGGESGRYRLLETLRQYGRQKLEAAGETKDIEARHTEWALALAEDVAPHLGKGESSSRLALLEADHDNLRAALGVASAAPSAEPFSRLVAALGPFWRARGYLEEGRSWVDLALSRSDTDPALRAAALAVGAALALRQGDFDTARIWCEERLSIAERLGDERHTIDAREGLARVLSRLGDDARARSLYRASLDAHRRSGDALGVAESLIGLAGVAPDDEGVGPSRALLGEAVAILRSLEAPVALARALTMWGQRWQGEDPMVARSALEEAVELLEGLGDRLALADALGALANLEQLQGDFAAADPLFERVLTIRRETGNRANLTQTLILAGHQTQTKGDYHQARRQYEEALAVSRQIGDTHGEANALDAIAHLDMFESDYASARPRLDRALGLVRDLGDQTCEQQILMALGDAAWGEGDVVGAMSQYRECLIWAGRTGRKPRALFCIERLGSAGAMGDFARAAHLLGAAQGLRDRLSLRRPLYSVPEWDQDMAIAREGLGDEAFEMAWAEGYAMPFDELVRYATQRADVDTLPSGDLVGASVVSNPGGGGRTPASDGSPGTDGAGAEETE